MPKTRIICTIGPASSSESVLRKMMLAGMDVARLNFSHGSRETHCRSLKAIRALNKRYRRSVRILQDLEGYRIRIGRFRDGEAIEVKRGEDYFFTNERVLGHDKRIPFDYRGELSDLKNAKSIFMDDGNIALKVKGRDGKFIRATAVRGGILKEHKGINIPDVNLKFKGLTQKDKTDLRFAIENKVDYVAQSFVRDASDMLEIRNFLGRSIGRIKLIAKIENRQGIKNIDSILKVCEGIMIARGDMGVSMPVYEIPVIQKMIIKKCNARKKLVITATQMLESMTQNALPTRAEVTDVANAVIDGSDSLMLSAETAAGKYPVESVKMMNQVIVFTEKFISEGFGAIGG